MTLTTDEWSVLTWILKYLAVAFVVFSAWCSAFRSPECRFGEEGDLITLGVFLALFWPVAVPCLVVVVVGVGGCFCLTG